MLARRIRIMRHNTKDRLVDPFNNIKYGDVSDEDITHFVYDADVPIRVECIGISHPNPEYYIERKHSDYYVFEYVLDGIGHIVCDGKQYEVHKDDVYILPYGSSHKYWADKITPYEKIWINIKSSIITEIMNAYGLKEKIVFKNSGCKPLFIELFRLAENTMFNDEVCYTAAEIIFRIINKLAQNEHNKTRASAVAKSTRVMLDDNIYGNITVDKIAETLVVSKVHVISEFKKYYRTTPYAYYMERKLEIAKEMLATTSMRINEIAETLGFCEQNYFSSLFKKKIGLSPEAYRKSCTQAPPPDNTPQNA